MIYIIGSELEHLQLEPLGIMKLDEFISDILITTGSKDYLGFIGGKEDFRKDIAITKPYKGTRPEKPEWFVFWQPILAQRMIEHWGFQPVTILKPTMPAQLPGLSTETCTVKLL
jgi:hypothetical protein